VAALTEAQLHRLWRGQRFPEGALATRDGVPVRVVFPGRPGRGPGPDFRGAAIAAPSGTVLHGDIELHVRSSLFGAHGHASDPAYGAVVLHVVFEDDTGRDTQLPGGGSAPVVALAPWVARRADELQRWLERPVLWAEPCHDAVLRLSKEGVLAALDAEGARRFAQKAGRWAESVAAEGVEQALYAGMLEALGYGGNALPMRALARNLPWAELAPHAHRATRIEEMLVKAAGVDAPLAARWEGPAWKLWGMRPANHPARRIAAAARLLARLGTPSAAFAALDAERAGDAIALFMLEDGRTTAAGSAANPKSRRPALIGRSCAIEILVNVVLPIAAGTGDEVLGAKARALYLRLPRPAAYGKTRFLENALGSMDIPLKVDARRAQGLLALNEDWCARNGCGRCPLSRT
jgi:hypothetical protein